MTALAFLFAVFLARPCPFYILDEVEAALDDLNLERFLSLLRRYADRAQFIVITHQKRTMEAADWLYGVSMAGNGVSKVLSRRLPPAEAPRVDGDGPAGGPGSRPTAEALAATASARGGRRAGGLAGSHCYRRPPVPRDWSDLFITGESETAAGVGASEGGGRRGSAATPAREPLEDP